MFDSRSNLLSRTMGNRLAFCHKSTGKRSRTSANVSCLGALAVNDICMKFQRKVSFRTRKCAREQSREKPSSRVSPVMISIIGASL